MSQTTQLNTDLIFSHEAWRDIKHVEPLINRAASKAYETACPLQECKGPHDVAINLANDSDIQALNQQFRGKNAPTNVLSFPFDDEFAHDRPGPKPLGDIIMALETITLEAGQQQKPIDHHIAHLVVHGMLHLFGYDHMNESEALEMEQLESQILASLSIPCPYGNDPIAMA